MRKLNEYLKYQAELEKRYNESMLIPGQVNNFGIIENINETYTDLTFENIDNYITSSLCTSYFSENPKGYWDNIFETLIKSHNTDKLINVLKKYFGDKLYDVKILNGSNIKSFEIFINDEAIAKNIDDYTQRGLYKQLENTELPQELFDIMNFYNYYFSKMSYVYGDREITFKILCEPKYSDKVNDIVYNDYNGILYHVTPNKNVDRILKRGLQLKGNNNLYRYFEPRINFYLADDEDVETIADLIALQKGYAKGSYAILKIDLNYGEKNKFNNSSYNIDFYHDNLYDEEYYVYTYGLIHPRFISVYKNLNESKGDNIDDQWLNDEKPVMTHDGRQVIITKIDYSVVPNIIYGKVKIKEKLFDYQWNEDGLCIKALDQMGNPKKADEADKLVKAV